MGCQMTMGLLRRIFRRLVAYFLGNSRLFSGQLTICVRGYRTAR